MIVHSHKSKINLFESVFRVFFQLSNGCTSLRVIFLVRFSYVWQIVLLEPV